jgi:hypothetical protein
MTADDGELELTTRNASAEELVALLRGQQARKVDVVAPAAAIRAENGLLVLDGTVPVLSSDGVTMTAGAYRPTEVCDGGIADKLGIPAAYLRRLRISRPGLFDANVNGWLAGDDRSFFVRCLRGQDGDTGVARAWLSDGYKPIDHLDTLTAVFDGIRAAGQPVSIDSCDLTERRMYVRIRCEAVRVLAPALLSGYKSPFTGAAGADNPVVFAGFVIANSETGCGACTVTPRLIAEICSNGMTITRDAVRAVHLGERMDEGVRWSGDTLDRQLALVTAKARDAVAAFLSPGYAQKVVRDLEKQAGHPVSDAARTVEVISGRLRYSEAQQAQVLDHFIKGGDLTAGGIMHAVTSAAQLQPDGDAAWDLENSALNALSLAASL